MWNLAKAYQSRPSDLLGLPDKVAAYHLDRAVMHFGTQLDEALEKATEQGKRKKPLSAAMRNQKIQETLNRWLGTKEKKRYRDPMLKLKG